jgi:methionine-rich copper-binding protein CopC
MAVGVMIVAARWRCDTAAISLSQRHDLLSAPVHNSKATSMSQFTRTTAITAIISVGLAGHALAHAHLKSAVPPADDAVSKSPTELDLKFSEGLDLKFSGVTVSGSDKAPVATGDAKLGTGDDTRLIVPVSVNLEPGVYTVDWHVLSNDGHKTKGSYTFTVK